MTVNAILLGLRPHKIKFIGSQAICFKIACGGYIFMFIYFFLVFLWCGHFLNSPDLLFKIKRIMRSYFKIRIFFIYINCIKIVDDHDIASENCPSVYDINRKIYPMTINLISAMGNKPLCICMECAHTPGIYIYIYKRGEGRGVVLCDG
jgi:hypothetical protein